MRSFEKFDMASVEWLTTHYLAKSNDRIRRLAELPIRAGDRVLDLCCGPGLFIPHILDLIGPTGHVTGLDLDAVSLDAAHDRLMATPHRNWNLVHDSIESNSHDPSEFDVILMFNCIGYFNDAASLVACFAKRMKPSARLIIKDFDLESFFFHPRNTEHWAKLIGAAKFRNDQDNPIKFDNFFGRNVHALRHTFAFSSYSNFTWTQFMSSPFATAEQEYVWRNVECLIKQAGSKCDMDTVEYFKSQFYPPDHRFFNRNEAMFIEVEYLTVLTI